MRLCESHILDEQAAARVPNVAAGAVVTSGAGAAQDARFSEIEAKLKESGLSAISVIRKPEVTWDNVAGARRRKGCHTAVHPEAVQAAGSCTRPGGTPECCCTGRRAPERRY